MKKTILHLTTVFFIAIAVIGVSSCSKTEDAVEDITVPVPLSINTNTEIEIPFAVSTEEVVFPDMPLNLDVEAKIKEEFPALSINNLKSAKLSSFSIDFLSSSNADSIKLNKVLSAKLLIKAPDLSDKEIATVENNTSETSLNFTPIADVELMDYLKSSNHSLYLKVTGTEIAETQMKVRVNSAFTIQVGL
ncbi:MAG: hypothetical protein E2590_06785 [Chryseobacterium sp.]|nr:hypothetical protein [Chryseobacterium sp.]